MQHVKVQQNQWQINLSATTQREWQWSLVSHHFFHISFFHLLYLSFKYVGQLKLICLCLCLSERSNGGDCHLGTAHSNTTQGRKLVLFLFSVFHLYFCLSLSLFFPSYTGSYLVDLLRQNSFSIQTIQAIFFCLQQTLLIMNTIYHVKKFYYLSILWLNHTFIIQMR